MQLLIFCLAGIASLRTQSKQYGFLSAHLENVKLVQFYPGGRSKLLTAKAVLKNITGLVNGPVDQRSLA